MRVLITGGSGFVGTVLTKTLMDNYDIIVFDIVPPEVDVTFIQGDITVYAQIEEAAQNADKIVHLAVNKNLDNPWEVCNVYLLGTINVLASAVKHNIQRVVMASSIAAIGYSGAQTTVYPPEFVPIDETHSLRPDSLHGVGKLMCEELLKRYTRRYGISTICLRLGRVGDEETVNSPPPQNTDIRSEVLWGLVDVRDVAQAFKLALEVENIDHETFIITAENLFARKKSIQLLKEYFPQTGAIHCVEEYLTNRKKGFFSIAKAKEKLGYKPKTNFDT